MELIQTTVELKQPFKAITLRPVSDLQYGAEGVAFETFKRYIREGIADDSFFIGLGDFLDIASPSNRERLRMAGLYDSILKGLDNEVENQMDKVMEVLRPTRGRWLGILAGHHYHEFLDKTTVEDRFCESLDAPFLGDSALIRIIFKDKGKRQQASCTLLVHHGVGSGQSTTAPLNKLEKLAAYFEADLYMMAHHHKLCTSTISRLSMHDAKKGPILKARPIYLACTGGYLRGYTQGSRMGLRPTGGYVEKKLLPPVGIGGIVVSLKPEVDEDGFACTEIRVTV